MAIVVTAFTSSLVIASDDRQETRPEPTRPNNVSVEAWERILPRLQGAGLKSFPATSEYKKIFPSTPGASASFGWSTAADGDTIVVGGYGFVSRTGAAFVFERNQGGVDNWGEVKKILASDSATYSYFGRSVSLSNDTLVVSADGAGDNGAVYVFERNQGGADNWGEVIKISGTNAGFGGSVGISNDLVVVGAKSESAAYLFERNQGGADSWGQIKKLTSGTPGTVWFGNDVAISGETVVVGAITRNSAYVFERNQGGADNWGEVAELTASDAESGDQFGGSVSISGDTVVVGAEWADPGGENRGAAYVFERNQDGADNWGEVAILAAVDAIDQNHLGTRVAIDGDVIAAAATALDGQGVVYLFDRNEGGAENWGQVAKLVAADGSELEFGVAVSGANIVLGAAADSTQTFGGGAAFVFRRSGDTWIQAQKTDADDTAGWNWFGFTLAMDGDVAVVGAWRADMDKGSAYVFERNQGGIDNWGQVAKLTASDGAMYEQFGFSVDISDDHVVVGAPTHGSGTSYYMAGAAYVFSRNHGGADTWGEVAKLMAPDATTYDQFGWSVAIDHDLVVVGANKGDGAAAGSGTSAGSGSAYLFARNQGGADTWGIVTELNASDGALSDSFGESVAVAGDVVAVGASGDESATGALYVYGRNQGGADTWGQVKKITASDGATGDYFGQTVAMQGSNVLVGAPYGDAAYMYERNQGGADTWGEVAILTASDGQAFDRFGYSVSLTAGLAAVGSEEGEGAVEGSGAVYLYHRNTGGADNWGELIKLQASDGALDDAFGHAVALSGHRVWCGAPFDDDVAYGSGAAYRFDLRAAVPEADLSITVDDSTSTAVPGETTTYVIEVGNGGPGDVTGASVSDTFPTGLECTWSCVATGSASCTAGPESGAIDDAVDLPMDETLTYTAVCSIDPSATGTISNTASVAPPGGYDDNNSNNNSETDVDTLSPEADLSITVDNGSQKVVLGASVIYTILVSNPGPSSVTGGAVGDVFPTDLTGVAWTCVGAGGGTCSASGSGDISESVDLPVGASVTFTATGTCDPGAAGQSIDNTATVTCPASVTELEPSDNTATDSDAIVISGIFSDGFESEDTLGWSSAVGN